MRMAAAGRFWVNQGCLQTSAMLILAAGSGHSICSSRLRAAGLRLACPGLTLHDTLPAFGMLALWLVGGSQADGAARASPCSMHSNAAASATCRHGLKLTRRVTQAQGLSGTCAVAQGSPPPIGL